MEEKLKQSIQKINGNVKEKAQKIGKQFKEIYDSNVQKLKTALQKLQESNKELIERLEKDINDLPNKIFENLGDSSEGQGQTQK
ncbi:hypothetical protein MSUIS_05110 [Mycoplasma suis KI3806]|uniref:Uncharacterized protein n=1 Tax=Mycoplasma suis (strain KI_3806) TaxID=708248 RepID=F0V1S3_MYCS3|nr:hypothetical protein [Mycoplasma suis]CBZ40604.1 hypothetical protein MSUIS_05110 [Mycoplasma suis KI3806]